MSREATTEPPVARTWSFRCSACGKCCNSAPQMSVPELFHHQRRFVGSLAIRRVPRLRPGTRLGGNAGATASDRDCDAYSDLADAVLHRLPGEPRVHDVLLATQGFSPSPSDPCPALGSDMRCTIHDDRKPATCAVVPLEALVPDRLQHVVLAERTREAAYLGADCVARGARPDFSRMTDRLAVVDDGARASLARRRRDLADEKRWWGESVFQMLKDDLFADATALARVPESGFLVMAMAPVLMVLATVSSRCRQRCLEYVDAQTVLIESSIRVAVARRRLDGRAEIEQLGAFARTHRALRIAFESAPARLGSRGPREARDVEAWMGLRGSSRPPSPATREDSRRTP